MLPNYSLDLPSLLAIWERDLIYLTVAYKLSTLSAPDHEDLLWCAGDMVKMMEVRWNESSYHDGGAKMSTLQ